jgi:hypothetical protein
MQPLINTGCEFGVVQKPVGREKISHRKKRRDRHVALPKERREELLRKSRGRYYRKKQSKRQPKDGATPSTETSPPLSWCNIRCYGLFICRRECLLSVISAAFDHGRCPSASTFSNLNISSTSILRPCLPQVRSAPYLTAPAPDLVSFLTVLPKEGAPHSRLCFPQFRTIEQTATYAT